MSCCALLRTPHAIEAAGSTGGVPIHKLRDACGVVHRSQWRPLREVGGSFDDILSWLSDHQESEFVFNGQRRFPIQRINEMNLRASCKSTLRASAAGLALPNHTHVVECRGGQLGVIV